MTRPADQLWAVTYHEHETLIVLASSAREAFAQWRRSHPTIGRHDVTIRPYTPPTDAT